MAKPPKKKSVFASPASSPPVSPASVLSAPASPAADAPAPTDAPEAAYSVGVAPAVVPVMIVGTAFETTPFVQAVGGVVASAADATGVFGYLPSVDPPKPHEAKPVAFAFAAPAPTKGRIVFYGTTDETSFPAVVVKVHTARPSPEGWCVDLEVFGDIGHKYPTEVSGPVADENKGHWWWPPRV